MISSENHLCLRPILTFPGTNSSIKLPLLYHRERILSACVFFSVEIWTTVVRVFTSSFPSLILTRQLFNRKVFRFAAAKLLTPCSFLSSLDPGKS